MAAGAMRTGLNAKRARTAWLFLAPSLVVLFAVALWPLGRAQRIASGDYLEHLKNR